MGINSGSVDASGDIATEEKQTELISKISDLTKDIKLLVQHLELLTEANFEEHNIEK